MVTLADFRTQVRAYLDDEDAARYSNAVIDFAARGALLQLVTQYADMGNALDQSAEVTTNTSGSIDLPANDIHPLRIHNVSLRQGNLWVPLNPVRERDNTQQVSASQTLRINYIARPQFPQGDGYVFDYGPTVSTDAWDNLLVVLTVKQLMTIEGEPHLLPRETEQSLWSTVLSDYGAPGAYNLMPNSGPTLWNHDGMFAYHLGYSFIGGVLQLVRL